jgi:hypothetical protein
LDEVARKAARETLGFSLAALPQNSELEYISALVLQNLHGYHFKCKMVVRDLLVSASWAEEMRVVPHLMSQCRHGLEKILLERVLVQENRLQCGFPLLKQLLDGLSI